MSELPTPSTASTTPPLGALATLYWTFNDTMAADFTSGRYDSSHSMAERLLTHADLPLVIRARALMILATSKVQDGTSLAEEAVRILDEDIRELTIERDCSFPDGQLRMARAVLATCKSQQINTLKHKAKSAFKPADASLQQPVVEAPSTTACAVAQQSATRDRRGSKRKIAELTQGLSNVSLETTATVDTATSGDVMTGIEVEGVPVRTLTKTQKRKIRQKRKKNKLFAQPDVTNPGFWNPAAAASASSTRPAGITTPAASREATPIPAAPDFKDLLLTPVSARGSKTSGAAGRDIRSISEEE